MAFSFPFVPPSWHLPLIILAGVSEFLDGYLARRWSAVTPLGVTLDPVADKIFILSTVLVLIVSGRLGFFDLGLVAFRDIVVTIGIFAVAFDFKDVSLHQLKPRWSGKIATTFQFLLILSFYAYLPITEGLLRITQVASVISGIDYLYLVLHRRFDFTDDAIKH